MDTVRVLRLQVLETVRNNLEEHIKVYNEAIAGYWAEVELRLQQLLSKRSSGEEIDLSCLTKLSKPQLHKAEYERVIKMMEMSVDDIIEMTATEFAQYIQDDWSWQRQWLLSNSTYSTTAMTKLRSGTFSNNEW